MADTNIAEPIRIFLVDDQQLVRAGFRMVLDSQPDMRVVAEAGDGQEAVSLARELLAAGGTGIDIVLMDVRMPHLDGIEAAEQILRINECAARIIMLTTFDLDEYVLQAIRAGASGFLLKDAPPEDMLAAIRTVHAGDAVIAPSSTRRLLAHLADALPAVERPDDQVLSELTEREKEVLGLMARGMSNAEISAELFVSNATVKTHVGRILAKLQARDRVQAVVIAFETGLVHPGA